jgi:hypothetical protein
MRQQNFEFTRKFSLHISIKAVPPNGKQETMQPLCFSYCIWTGSTRYVLRDKGIAGRYAPGNLFLKGEA